MKTFKDYIKSEGNDITVKNIKEAGNEGRFESGTERKRVIGELTKAFGKPKVVIGFKSSGVLEVVYSDYNIILTNIRVLDVITKLGKQDYEVQISKATNGVMVTVMDLNAA